MNPLFSSNELLAGVLRTGPTSEFWEKIKVPSGKFRKRSQKFANFGGLSSTRKLKNCIFLKFSQYVFKFLSILMDIFEKSLQILGFVQL